MLAFCTPSPPPRPHTLTWSMHWFSWSSHSSLPHLFASCCEAVAQSHPPPTPISVSHRVPRPANSAGWELRTAATGPAPQTLSSALLRFNPHSHFALRPESRPYYCHLNLQNTIGDLSKENWQRQLDRREVELISTETLVWGKHRQNNWRAEWGRLRWVKCMASLNTNWGCFLY